MRIFLSGHTSCDNRGSAAIVESTVRALWRAVPDLQIAMTAWPPFEEHVRLPADIVPHLAVHELPRGGRVHAHLRRLRPGASGFLRSAWTARLLPAEVRRAIAAADAVLSIGGDLYSGDYGFPVGVYAADAYALALGKPVYLWSASLGRYPAGSAGILAPHLERFKRLFLRDELSIAFAEQTLSKARIARAVDPAFTLPPMPFGFDGPERFDLAINLSRLSFELKGVGDAAAQLAVLERIIVDFATASGISTPAILLLPHVFRRDSATGDDHAFLATLRDQYRGPARLTIAPTDRLAGEYKWLLGRCDHVIAARTHVTIAAFSQAIPTISISYSLKARGLNCDIFGHERFCYSAEVVRDADLADAFKELMTTRETVCASMRGYLSERRKLLDAAVDEVCGRATAPPLGEPFAARA